MKKSTEKELQTDENMEIPQVDGMNDPKPKLRRSKRNRTNSNDKHDPSSEKNATKKVVKSKYKFSGKNRLTTNTNEDTGSEDEQENDDKSLKEKRDLSPAKKISKLVKSKMDNKKENVQPITNGKF